MSVFLKRELIKGLVFLQNLRLEGRVEKDKEEETLVERDKALKDEESIVNVMYEGRKVC